MNRYIFTALLMLLFATGSSAHTVFSTVDNVVKSRERVIPPQKVSSNLPQKSEVSYTFNEYGIVEDGSSQSYLTLEGFGLNDTEGEYAYLNKRDNFIVPKGYDAVLKINKAIYSEISIDLATAKMSDYDSMPERIDNPEKSPAVVNKYYPDAFVMLENVEGYRGYEIQPVKVIPMQYNNYTKKARILSRLDYTIEFVKKTSVGLPPSPQLSIISDNYISQSFDNSHIFNFGSDNNAEVKEYLIVTVNSLREECEHFAVWKKRMGLNANVISKNSWSASEIKKSIQSFSSSHPNLYYLLLVGDNEQVPYAETVRNLWDERISISDVPYSCIDNDNLPDLMMGRIPARTPEEANTILSKILSMELNPPVQESYYTNCIHAGYFQSDYAPYDIENRAFIMTSETILQMMKSQGKNVKRVYKAEARSNPIFMKDSTLLPLELTRPTYNWDGSHKDITKAINEGAYYVFHRDHGVITGWHQPEYKISHIDNLSNYKLTPVVFSINCLTGQFDYSECFAEKLIRYEKGGAVGVFAAAGVSPTKNNNSLSVGMFKTITENNNNHCNPTLGEILLKGMQYMYDTGGHSYNSNAYERKIYHCFGDPSMEFRTDKPQPIGNLTIDVDTHIKVVAEKTDAKIIIYDETNNVINHYNSGNVNYPVKSESDLSILIYAYGKHPSLFKYKNGSLIICGEDISGNYKFSASKIIIGNSEDSFSIGSRIIFHEGMYTFKGSVYFDGEVEFETEAEIIMEAHS